MKTMNSPSAMAARGGHPSLALGAVPRRNLRGAVWLAAAIAVALSACTSRSREAFFDVRMEWPGQWLGAGHVMGQFASSTGVAE